MMLEAKFIEVLISMVPQVCQVCSQGGIAHF